MFGDNFYVVVNTWNGFLNRLRELKIQNYLRNVTCIYIVCFIFRSRHAKVMYSQWCIFMYSHCYNVWNVAADLNIKVGQMTFINHAWFSRLYIREQPKVRHFSSVVYAKRTLGFWNTIPFVNGTEYQELSSMHVSLHHSFGVYKRGWISTMKSLPTGKSFSLHLMDVIQIKGPSLRSNDFPFNIHS